MLARMCSHRGCTRIVAVDAKTRCPEHHRAWSRADSTRRRNKPGASVYHTAGWRGPSGTRQRVLERDGHQCQLCPRPATHVDHVVPLRECLHLGIDPLDATNCRALCASCAGSVDAGRARTTTPYIA